MMNGQPWNQIWLKIYQKNIKDLMAKNRIWTGLKWVSWVEPASEPLNHTFDLFTRLRMKIQLLISFSYFNLLIKYFWIYQATLKKAFQNIHLVFAMQRKDWLLEHLDYYLVITPINFHHAALEICMFKGHENYFSVKIENLSLGKMSLLFSCVQKRFSSFWRAI